MLPCRCYCRGNKFSTQIVYLIVPFFNNMILMCSYIVLVAIVFSSWSTVCIHSEYFYGGTIKISNIITAG